MTVARLPFVSFALLSLALTTFLVLQIANLELSGRATYHATFTDAAGLQAGDDVRVSGVRVGRVDDVQVVEGRARVRFAVDPDLPVPVDTVAAIQWVNLIGINELVLHLGEDGRTVEDGGTIEETTPGTDLAALAEALGPLTATLDPERANQVVAALLRVVDGRQDDLSRLLVDLDATLATFTDRDEVIGGLVDDYAAISAAVAQRQDQIVRLVDHLGSLTGTLDVADAVIEAAVTDTGRTLVNADRFLAASADDLSHVVADLAELATILNQDLDTVERAVAQLPRALRHAIGMGAIGPAIELDVCTSPTDPPCSVVHLSGASVVDDPAWTTVLTAGGRP